MIAGTLIQLTSPLDERLETWFQNGRLPALEVERTQTSFDDRPVQSGTAAAHTDTTAQDISVGTNTEGESVAIDIERRETRETIATNWVADVTGTGLFIAESVEGTELADFPIDLLWNVTGVRPQALQVNVEALHQAWDREDTLGDVWMTGADPGDGASIDYHKQADKSERPTIGMGFERPWGGWVVRGVVYQSGYVAIYSSSDAPEVIRFIEEELLPYASVPDEEDESEQQELPDETDDVLECEKCGRESESVGDDGYCIVCRDKLQEDGEYAELDTVDVAGGDDE